MRTLPRIKHWRWWAVAAAAGALVIWPRQRRWSSVKEAPSPDQHTAAVDAAAQEALANRELSEIFVLARHFITTRAIGTDAGREACLARAAEIVLKGAPAAAPFVAMHRDAFLQQEKHGRAEPACERCGAPMREAGSHDAELAEWMPVWTCSRCGAQVPR